MLAASILLKSAAAGGVWVDAAAPGASMSLGLLVMMASHELVFCSVRSVDPKLREKANIQSNIYLGVKSGSSPLFLVSQHCLLLCSSFYEIGHLSSIASSWASLLSLSPLSTAPAVVPGPPTSHCMWRLCWAAVCHWVAIKIYYR